MKVFTHNFNPNSNSGPNKFSRTLFSHLIKQGKMTITSQAEADVEFCLIQQQAPKVKPMVLRLDGIWFNSEQDFNRQNAPIQYSYNNADAVVFQSNFNKLLTEKWFGKRKNTHVIHNAADNKLIMSANKNFWNEKFKNKEVWSCASNWRPHKRLRDNINYFLEFAPPDALLAIAGNIELNEAKRILAIDPRIKLLGELDYMSLLCLYKRSTTFIHLAYLDHCPNVVVDAQACGCKIICSSTGGTQEVVEDGILIIEDRWDMKPCQLYKPPKLDFKNKKIINLEKKPAIKNKFENCTDLYYNIFKQLE